MKIKFLNFNLDYADGDVRLIQANTNLYVLKSYYKFKGKYPEKFHWLDPVLHGRISADEVIDETVAEEPDILCLSMFAWNSERLFFIASKLKEIFPNLIVIAGGPDLAAHKQPGFFDEHPQIDYVVYGDGEEPFVELLDSIVEKRPINDTVNLVTRDRVYPHRVFSDKEFNSVSPILECKTDIIRDMNNLFDLGYGRIEFRWERSRGCPYACSFCDWSAGLHNKVKRKTCDWRAELDFLYSIDDRIYVSPTDANWGIFKEDIEITEYAVQKGLFRLSNVAKLNKERAYRAYELALTSENNKSKKFPGKYMFPLKISLQDIHDDVLTAIDRPEIPWEEHKKYIRDFNSKYPEIDTWTEIILGMPYQTIDDFMNQLREFDKLQIKFIIGSIWQFLPNSPAFSKAYQEKYQLKTGTFIIPTVCYETKDHLKDAVTRADQGWTRATYVIETNTLKISDMLLLFALVNVYNTIRSKPALSKKPIITMIEKMLPKLKKFIDEHADQMLNEGLLCVYNKELGGYTDLVTYFSNFSNLKKFF